MSATEESGGYGEPHEATCDACARFATRTWYVGDATVCADCLYAHELALDAAVVACVQAFPSSIISTEEYRQIAAVAVKAYEEWPGDDRPIDDSDIEEGSEFDGPLCG